MMSDPIAYLPLFNLSWSELRPGMVALVMFHSI
jgi:hypothetical protein